MKIPVILAGMAIAVSNVLFAGPIPMCAPGSYASYQALTMGCSVSDQLFSGFTVLPTPPGSTSISPNSITVTPINSSQPGLQFSGIPSASAGQTFEDVFGFNITPIGSNIIAGSMLTQTGASATGDGSVIGIEQMCFSAISTTATCPGAHAFRNLGTDAILGTNTPTDSLTFGAPRSLLGVIADFSTSGGSSGSGSVSSFSVQVNEVAASSVPEPATFLLSGFALAGLGGLKLRKRGVRRA